MAASSTQVRLAWTDTSANENGFRVERCTGGSCTAFAVVSSLPVDSSSYTNTGLKANTNYRYRVVAWKDAGASAYSSIAAAKTPRREPGSRGAGHLAPPEGRARKSEPTGGPPQRLCRKICQLSEAA